MTNAPRLRLEGSRLFTAWLASARASLAFTTYQAGKLFLIGMRPDGRLSIFERTFERSMGLAASRDTLWMSSLYQLWRFENFLDPGEAHEGHDAVYVPVAGHTTGDIDVHDIQEAADGRPVFVATRLNCLATLGGRFSLRELWRPPFIDRLAVEDRCHLNGLAMRDGRPAYVTAASRSNLAEGWREHRRDGGVVIDVASGEIVAAGFSMPHSPRLHRGRLWLMQAGTGEFGQVDLATGIFTPVCFLPGFARGLAFLGGHAVIGVSRPRESRTFEGLLLNERLAREKALPRCGLWIVNLATGDAEHRLEIEGVVQELYDVAVIQGVIRPTALGFKSDEIRFMIRPEPG
ncbi:MAG TPA: TIGR03032 family protein [Paracoccaceae bacterium]|nr:TIGR03032 family protein [Paracoccaceae bacterium]